MANYRYDVDSLADGLIGSAEIDGFLSDLARYALMCSENRGIEDILQSPHVLGTTKMALIETLIVPFFGAPFAAFLKRLQQNGDLVAFPHIVNRLRQSVREKCGACFADVFSQVSLTEEQLSRIRTHLEILCSHRVYVTNLVDHELLGGFVISIEGRRIDFSVQGDLLKVRTRLLEEPR